MRMPEEVKSVTDDLPCESSEYSPDLHQQHHLLHEREMSRSESSNCSDESACDKFNGPETQEIIPTRTLKTSTPKPAANPLQFVKIGPCDLYRSAQQQLQKVEEVKKPKKEVKDEIEDWQSNLDNWKCSRRKQQEHIIERVVEVKKLELEEHDRNRKRTKTFNEMMEERTSKGRKLSLPVYLDEDTDDLSDLGISSVKNTTKSSSPIPEELDEKNEQDEDRDGGGAAGSLHRHDEATYESAIQSYETRMKSLANGGIGGSDSGTSEGKSATSSTYGPAGGPKKYVGRRVSAAKIEEKLGELERVKNRSVSSTDLSGYEVSTKLLGIPKVNIFARKEVFERRLDEANDQAAKSARAAFSEQVPRVPTIKERLCSLERSVEEGSKAKSNAPPAEISVCDRLSSINEKLQTHSVAGSTEKCVVSPAAATSSRSVAQHKSAICLRGPASSTFECKSKSDGRLMEERVKCAKASTTPIGAAVGLTNGESSFSGRSSSSEDYENVAHSRVGNHFHHRSLDSLQGHDSSDGFCFERVQSLECVDCSSGGGVDGVGGGGNYPASVLSGDTDREDSGIHTADVSSSVSQADDFDLHADSSIDADLKCTPLSPTPAAVIVDDGVGESSQSSGCRSRDRFAEGEPSPPATVSTCDANRQREPTDNYRCVVEASSCGPLAPAFQCCGERQFDDGDRRLSSCSAGVIYEMCALIDEDKQNCVANRVAAAAAKCECDDESLVSDEPSESSESRQAMRNAAQLTDQIQIRKVENMLDVNDEMKQQQQQQQQQCDVKQVSGLATISRSLHSDEMAVGSESKFVSSFREISNASENESSDQLPGSKSGSSTPDGLVSVHSSQVFSFDPSATVAEPPKEKPPPPPPTDNSDDDGNDQVENGGLHRMDSTKRIKKEIRLKRSSFLGIEGYEGDSYLEPELESVKRPPDMTTFLQEERRLEKLLYRQSICSESDSTQGESRDSGVELDKNHVDEHSWVTEDTHSRQDSKIYANTIIMSEEDEIIRKEREILEILELEERRNYENDSKNNYGDLGKKLVLKLKELESRKSGYCWNRERGNRMDDCNSIDPLICNEYPKAHTRSQSQPLKQRKLPKGNRSDSDLTALSHQTQRVPVRSLQDVTRDSNANDGNDGCLEYDKLQGQCDFHHRSSMPNIRQELISRPSPYHREPPVIPPNKPAHAREGGLTINNVSCPQQMTKQTLQALSAVPRSKIVATDSWVLSKKKPRQEVFNYQHWLIQEAEHRRITEYHQRYGNDSGLPNQTKVQLEFTNRSALLPSNDTTTLENRSPAHHPGRFTRLQQQMLPSYCNHDRAFVEDKKPTKSHCKPLPDSVIQTLTQRVQSRLNLNEATNKPKWRENYSNSSNQQEKMLSVSGKKKCSHCGEELGRGAAMIIESLRLFYHIDCFKCCVCCVQLGDGLMGTDVRVRNSKLHCHSCYSNDEGVPVHPANWLDFPNEFFCGPDA